MRVTRLRQWIRSTGLLAVLPSLVAAQAPVFARITGTVYDSVARRALSGAIVRMVRIDNPAVGRSTTSDAFGSFTYDSAAW
jgi:hypothetical protein